MPLLDAHSSAASTFERLLRATPAELAHCDIAEMNLLCARGLPGAEDLDVPASIALLDQWGRIAQEKVDWSVHCFREEPARYDLPPNTTENRFRMMRLVTVMKKDFGIRYSPDYIHALGNAVQIERLHQDSKLLLLNGLLSDQRVGTCNSIPVLVVALARRLGYPVNLVTNGQHVWARWQSPSDQEGKERFNIEASNSAGMVEHDDDYYARGPHQPMDAWARASGYFLHNFTPQDDLALFLMTRAWVLETNGRGCEALPLAARACFLAPRDPTYPRHAGRIVLGIMHQTRYGKPLPLPLTQVPPGMEIQNYFTPKGGGAQALNVYAHGYEIIGRIDKALAFYEGACEADPEHPDFREDLERYRLSLTQGEGRKRAGTMRWAAMEVASARMRHSWDDWLPGGVYHPLPQALAPNGAMEHV